MFTDLFLALLDKENRRGHPILAALLYTFCPAAARWWLAGADPVLPFDPLWRALEDLNAGGSLKDALSRYGFEDLLEEAREFVAQVDAWRDRHPGIVAPERLPTFSGGHLDMPRRFGHQSAIAQFGGRWEDFFAYVRAWAFIVRDWEAAMRFSAPPEIRPGRLAFTLAGLRSPAYLPAWSWVSRFKNATRIVVGIVISNQEQDQLRLCLAGRASPAGDKPWPSAPEVWALERETGRADHFDARLDEGALAIAVEKLAEAAKNGPYPPLAALQGSIKCNHCGFRAQCFAANGEITSLALAFDDNAHSHGV
jgi:hypothetical protein